MDQLKQIITYKLKVIQDYQDKTPASVEQRQQITEFLLKQKRKENSRDVIQSRLLQSLITKRIQTPYRIQEFYQQSIQLMQMYSPSFQYQEFQTKDPIGNIVKLYVEFFNQQDCPRRAQELNHIFKKNLCEKGLLIPTVFHWFAEWLKKIFRQFVKRRLSQLSEKNHQSLMEENKKKRNIKFLQQLSNHRASLSLIDSQIKQHKQNELGLKLKGKSKLLHIDLGIKTAKNSSNSQLLDFRERKSENLSLSKLKDDKKIIELHQKKVPFVNFAKQSIEYQKQKQKNNLNLNRDIFFSAFYEEISNYYKFYSCLGQIDDNYPKNFRKVDRRQQINKNINVLVKSVAKNQPNDLKNSIQEYYALYSAKYSQVVSRKEQNRQKKKATKRAQSVNIPKQNYEKNSFFQQKKELHSISTENNIKRQPHTTRVEAEKKKIQLLLPDLKSFKSAQKLILVNSSNSQELISNHYKKNSNPKQRISAELYKELRQISSLFKSRKGMRVQSLSINKQSIQKRISSIRYKRGHNQASSEIFESPIQPDGIFRLPKIHK